MHERFYYVQTNTYTENKAVVGAGLSYAFTPALAGRIEVQKPHSEITQIAAGVALAF